MVEVPVLYITFCRPEYARLSFDAIKRAQPRKLYFYSNKAREDRPDEVRRNEEVRAFVKEIDWDCEVVTWFRDEYVDIYTSLWGAMDWLFSNEEKGIVLEEDCVASEAFFTYCEKMLEFYKDDKRVSIISGNNRTPEYNPSGKRVFLTTHVDIYGWANWANRWKSNDWEMKQWPIDFKKVRLYFGDFLPAYRIYRGWKRLHSSIKTYRPWDRISAYNRAKNNTYGLIPATNLVEDIGKYGVHHKNSINESEKIEVHLPLENIYESFIGEELVLDRYYEHKNFVARTHKEFRYIIKNLPRKMREILFRK